MRPGTIITLGDEEGNSYVYILTNLIETSNNRIRWILVNLATGENQVVFIGTITDNRDINELDGREMSLGERGIRSIYPSARDYVNANDNTPPNNTTTGVLGAIRNTIQSRYSIPSNTRIIVDVFSDGYYVCLEGRHSGRNDHQSLFSFLTSYGLSRGVRSSELTRMRMRATYQSSVDIPYNLFIEIPFGTARQMFG